MDVAQSCVHGQTGARSSPVYEEDAGDDCIERYHPIISTLFPLLELVKELTHLTEDDVLNLRTTHRYGKTLYWAGQLFSGDFDTSPVNIVEELDEEER